MVEFRLTAVLAGAGALGTVLSQAQDERPAALTVESTQLAAR